MKFLVIPCLKKSRYISPTYQKLKKKLNITVMNMLFEVDMFEIFLIRREKHDFILFYFLNFILFLNFT